jgi:hypothetical protein
VDTYVTLREMWQGAVRRKNLIRLALVISVVVGAFVAYRPGLPPESRQYTVWLASADILVDTADSQVVDSKGPDFLSLANRTSLLGNLIATKPLRTAIGERAGVDSSTLVVVPPANTSTSTTGGVGLTPTPVSTAGRDVPDSEATVLTVSTDASLPILRVTAQAPDAATAARLTTATSTELAEHLKTVGATEEIPAPRKLVLRPLAAPTPSPVTRGTSRSLGILVAIMLALLACGAIVTAPMIARRWRSAAEAADREAEAAASPEVEENTDPVPITADTGSNGLFDRTFDEDQSSPAVTDLAAAAAARENGENGSAARENGENGFAARENGSAFDPADPREEPRRAGDGVGARREQIRAGDGRGGDS